MRFSTFLLGLLPLAFATPIDVDDTFSLEARADNTNAILKDIAAASAATAKLNGTLNKVPDNGPISSKDLKALISDNNAIEKALAAAGKSTSSSPDFSSADSKKLYDAVVAAETPTFDTLTNIVNHKPAFDSAGLTSTVLSDVKKQKSLIDALGKDLQAKVTAPYKKKAPAVEQAYDQHFSAAISALSG